MKRPTKRWGCLLAAALIPALLCTSGCTGDKSTAVEEDDSFICLEESVECYNDDEIRNGALELAKAMGDSWYRDGDYVTDSSEHGWLLDYTVSAHTQDGRGVLALHIPGSAGMSQEDFMLLTTKDYGMTWVPGGEPYHIVGQVAQITINRDNVYLVIDSGAYGNSCVMLSEDFGGTFETYNANNITPEEYRGRMSDLYGVYMRIVNTESDGEIVLEYFFNGYIDDIGSDSAQKYESSAMSDKKRVIMILRSDACFSQVKTLYIDDGFFG